MDIIYRPYKSMCLHPEEDPKLRSCSSPLLIQILSHEFIPICTDLDTPLRLVIRPNMKERADDVGAG